MTPVPTVELRNSAPLGASGFLCFALCCGALLFGSLGAKADDPSGQLVLNPTSGPVTLTLQGPAFETTDAANYGLVLSYHDEATASAVFQLFRAAGRYQWQFSTAPEPPDTVNVGRLAMVLEDDHSLTLYDRANPTDASQAIVLRPGTGGTSGIYWNGHRLATLAEVSSGYVALSNGGMNVGTLTVAANGAVGIGTTDPQYALDIHGATSTTRLYLPATADANTGVLYSGADPLMHTFGTNNLFLGANAGNFTMTTSDATNNTAIGANALQWIIDGNCNLAVGQNALLANRHGSGNVALGDSALYGMQDGFGNIAIGRGAGGGIDGPTGNIAIGYNALPNAGYGLNTAIGYYTMSNVNWNNGEAYCNVGVGCGSLGNLFNGEVNTGIGTGVLSLVTNGYGNTAIGSDAGGSANNLDGVTTGNNNTFLGYRTGFTSTDQHNNATAIGYNAKVGADNALVLGGTDDNAVNVGINTTTPQAKLDVNGDAVVRGVLHVAPAGDIDMGDFTAGTNPAAQP
jgi:hypothetical protein